MTAPVADPSRRRAAPWSTAEDGALIDLVSGIKPVASPLPTPAEIAAAAEVVRLLGHRTQRACATRVCLLSATGRVSARAASRAAAAFRRVPDAGDAPKEVRPSPVIRERIEVARTVPTKRAAAIDATRPASAPPLAKIGDGVDPWRAARFLRSIDVSDRAIAAKLADLCAPELAPKRTPTGRGEWSADDVRALLGS
jgi:hypothetical protein